MAFDRQEYALGKFTSVQQLFDRIREDASNAAREGKRADYDALREFYKECGGYIAYFPSYIVETPVREIERMLVEAYKDDPYRALSYKVMYLFGIGGGWILEDRIEGRIVAEAPTLEELRELVRGIYAREK